MLKVAFFGSSTFSLQSLRELVADKEISVECVITTPAKEKNRGHKLQNNVVYDCAVELGIDETKIFTPKSLRKSPELIEHLKGLNLDFIVVVAYGKIITKEIIDLPRYEILNLHPSSLPKFRGASPIERSIEAGESELDICIMRIDEGLDTGDVGVRKPFNLQGLHADEAIPQISAIGSKLLVETIHKIVEGKIVFEKQIGDCPKYAEKIDKSELLLDFNQNAELLYNKIRAFNCDRGCYFILDDQRVKVLRAEIKKCDTAGKQHGFDKKTGEIVADGGVIIPQILQKEGKNPVKLKDFLNGLKN